MNTSTKSKDTVVLLGHTGFLGRSIAGFLGEKGIPIRGSSSQTCNLLEISEVERLFAGIEEFKVIVSAGITRRTDNSFEAMTRNLRMMHNLAEVLASRNPKGLIYLSSVDVYGQTPSLPITEKTPAAPETLYGIGKLASEHLLRQPEKLTCPVTILRLPGVYGPGDQGQSTLGRFYTQMRTRRKVTLYGNPKFRQDFLEVEILCDVVWRLLQHPLHETINVVRGEGMTMSEWVELVARAAGLSPELAWDAPAHFANDLLFDISYLRALFPDLSFAPLPQQIGRYVQSLEPLREASRG